MKINQNPVAKALILVTLLGGGATVSTDTKNTRITDPTSESTSSRYTVITDDTVTHGTPTGLTSGERTTQ